MSETTITNLLLGEQLEMKLADALELMKLRQPEHNWTTDKLIKLAIGDGLNLLFRRHNRKSTNLPGVYRKYSPDMVVGAGMTVENLSESDIGFRAEGTHQLREKEILDLEFILDDPQRTVIPRKAIIRRIEGRLIGAEFCEPDDMAEARAELLNFLEKDKEISS